MPARTVLVLQHIEVEKPGLILDALDGSGLDIDILNLVDRRDVSASDLPRVSDLAGLVVMGGPMNADDLAGHPALELERGLLADAAVRDPDTGRVPGSPAPRPRPGPGCADRCRARPPT